MGNKRELFLRAYANIPENLKEDIIVVVDNKSYTWNAAYIAIRDNTDLGKKIIKVLSDIEVI